MLDCSLTDGAPVPARYDNLPPLVQVDKLNLWYGEVQALKEVSFDVRRGEILALVGPSGCGKSTALKALNRMHDDTRDVRLTGSVRFDGAEAYAPGIDPPVYRRHFGWVAQKPNPFPMTIYENVAYGARLHGICEDRAGLDAHVEDCLRAAGLWEEVADRLHVQDGTDLSGGQQQRLCIARALSTKPDVLLMDEPTGSIDPIATERIEALMLDLKSRCAVVVITHSMMQARRISDRVAYFHLGRLLEVQRTPDFFASPRTPEAEAFVHGVMG